MKTAANNFNRYRQFYKSDEISYQCLSVSQHRLGSVDVLSKKLIYIFQLDNLKHDFFNSNSGMDYR